MFKKKILNNETGSALVMVIIISVAIILLGSAMATLSLNWFQTSVVFSDANKSYFYAEAGVEQVIKCIDLKVGEIQEESRTETTLYIKKLIDENPLVFREANGELKDEAVASGFSTEYLDKFNVKVNNYFSNINNEIIRTQLIGNDINLGENVELEITQNGGTATFESGSYDGVNKLVTIVIKGTNKDIDKKISVTIDLSPEVNTPYNIVSGVQVQNGGEINEHEILNKSIISEKNLIVAGGTLNVTGDVLSFGTIPYVLDNGKKVEDESASWDNYGGVLVGMCNEIYGNNVALGFDSSKVKNNVSGIINVNGNLATLGYVHSLYGTDGDSSQIVVNNGGVYARAVKSERSAGFSYFDMDSIYVMDNLQIDSYTSTVNIDDFYGFVDAGYMIDGSGSGGDMLDSIKPKRTSSIIVNGSESNISINDEVYIGGSSFLSSFVDSEGNPFLLGTSAVKSSERAINLFFKDEEYNPTNNLYWYESGSYTSETPIYKTYSNSYIGDIDVFDGKSGDPGNFSITKKAMHLTKMWNDYWKNDELYSNYIDCNSITINEEAGKLKGYSKGAVAANGKIYGVNEFNNGENDVLFHSVQMQCINSYYDNIKGLLAEELNQDAPKLNYTEATQSILEHVNTDFVGVGYIEENTIYIPDELMDTFVYYGTSNTDITTSSGEWYIDGELMESSKGIILIDGNLYIDHGFKFEGVILATGNIIFKGDSEIIYSQNTVSEILSSDININGFFGALQYDLLDQGIKSQRTQEKNINIVEWKQL